MSFPYNIEDVLGQRPPGTASPIVNIHDEIALAENSIYRTYGDVVSVWEKGKSLLKFGYNPSVTGTKETVWSQGGTETYSTTNDIDTLSSSDDSDTQSVVVEGHTISGGLLTFVVQSKTLTGQTPATLDTPLARITRLYNDSATSFAGNIYASVAGSITSGVPQTAANIRMLLEIGDQQSQKAATSISNLDYYILTSLTAFVFEKTQENVEFDLESRVVSGSSKVFRSRLRTVASSGNPSRTVFSPPLVIPKNSDIQVTAKSDGTACAVGAYFEGYLASVIA